MIILYMILAVNGPLLDTQRNFANATVVTVYQMDTIEECMERAYNYNKSNTDETFVVCVPVPIEQT